MAVLLGLLFVGGVSLIYTAALVLIARRPVPAPDGKEV